MGGLNGSGNGESNGNKTAAEKLSNNIYSILVARFILPGLIALVGWFAANAFGDLKDSVKETRLAVESVDLRVNTTLNAFERRINVLEDRNLFAPSLLQPSPLQRHQ
jgi:hypothetical protein